MAKGHRQGGGPEQAAESRQPQRVSRPAPGKVTRTSKLPPGGGPAVQRKAAAPASGAAGSQGRSLWDLTMDSGMDAAHRGVTALAEENLNTGAMASSGAALAVPDQEDPLRQEAVAGPPESEGAGTVSGAPVQRQAGNTLAAVTLSSITCYSSDDLTGDDVYITVNDRRVWGPVPMGGNETKSINRTIDFSTQPLTIRVFDQETVGRDDEIGAITLPVPQSEEEIRRSPSSADLTSAGAYRLYFQVHRV